MSKENYIMMNPTMSELLKKVDNTYTLCNLVGKRARQIVDGAHPLSGGNPNKSVTVATNEVGEGKITYVRNKSEIK
jgi:DNA-directed RNA polymerase subunit omega